MGSMDTFQLDDVCRVVSSATLRTGRELTSQWICEYPPGTLLKILEFDSTEIGRQRARVQTQLAYICGWISIRTAGLVYLVEKVEDETDETFSIPEEKQLCGHDVELSLDRFDPGSLQAASAHAIDRIKSDPDFISLTGQTLVERIQGTGNPELARCWQSLWFDGGVQCQSILCNKSIDTVDVWCLLNVAWLPATWIILKQKNNPWHGSNNITFTSAILFASISYHLFARFTQTQALFLILFLPCSYAIILLISIVIILLYHTVRCGCSTATGLFWAANRSPESEDFSQQRCRVWASVSFRCDATEGLATTAVLLILQHAAVQDALFKHPTWGRLHVE